MAFKEAVHPISKEACHPAESLFKEKPPMKKKRIQILVITALVLVVTSLSAFAVPPKTYTTEINAICAVPDIEVVVPSGMNAYLNPESLSATIDGRLENGQIISAPSWIENRSVVPIQLDVSITGTINSDSDMALVSESTKNQDLRSKWAFVYFEIQSANARNWSSWDSKYNEDKHMLVRVGTRTRKNAVRLDAGGSDNSFGVYRLAGDCVENPRSPWTTQDGFDVEVVFTFTPLPVI